ncbi:MAG: glycosyltransferase family 39 protein [Anaerolineae bacterium]
MSQATERAKRGISGQHLAIFLLILLAGLALRLYRLGHESLWYDETVSVLLARKSLSALTAHTAGDIHPPLYYYLLHFWIRLAGSSEFSLAFLSLVFGLLLIPLLFYLGRGLYGAKIGLLGALLLALSPFNLWYSQEVRMYTLGAFLGLISLLFLLRLIKSQARLQRGYGAGYILASALGLYTLYYFAFLLLAQNLMVIGLWLARWVKGKQRLSLLPWISSQVGILLLYLPWLPIAFRQATNPPVPPWRTFTGFAQVGVESWSALSFGQSVDPKIVWPLLLLTLALFALGLFNSFRMVSDSWFVPLSLAGHTLLPILLIYLFSLIVPLFHIRYVFTYSPSLYLLLAVGLVRLKRKPLAVLSLLFILGASAYSIYNFHFDPHYASDDHRGAVGYLEERLRSGDAVLINAGYAYPAFLYYYEGSIAWQGRLANYQDVTDVGEGTVVLQTGSIGGQATLGWGNPNSDFYATTEEETAHSLEELFSRHPRVWVFRIYDTVTDPQGFIRKWLEEHGRKFEDQLFAGQSFMRVQGFLTHPGPIYEVPDLPRPVGVELGGQVRLEGFEGGVAPVRAGETLDLALYWRATQRLDIDYHVVLYLVDGQGQVWAQTDEMPLGSLYLTSRWKVGEVLREPMRLEIPEGTPGGEYALQVAIYDLASGQFLSVEDERWRADGEWVRLGSLLVIEPS